MHTLENCHNKLGFFELYIYIIIHIILIPYLEYTRARLEVFELVVSRYTLCVQVPKPSDGLLFWDKSLFQLNILSTHFYTMGLFL